MFKKRKYVEFNNYMNTVNELNSLGYMQMCVRRDLK